MGYVQLAFVLARTRSLVHLLARLSVHRLSRALESTRILTLVLSHLSDLLLLLVWQSGRIKVSTFSLLRAGPWNLRVERLFAVSHTFHLLERLKISLIWRDDIRTETLSHHAAHELIFVIALLACNR